jgi:hypothetical protein
MQGFPLRVTEEKSQVDQKIVKLHAFFMTDAFTSLVMEDQDLLREQSAYMRKYSEVLGRRIARF